MRSRWRRGFAIGFAAVWLGLTAVFVPPARARGDRDGGTASPASATATSNEGTGRLVRIGPQALVMVHEDGRVSMVEEAPPQRSRGATLAIALGAALALPLLTGATNPGPAR